MIKTVRIFITAMLISSAVFFMGTAALSNISAMDNKTGISASASAPSENKKESSIFKPASAPDDRAKLDDQMLIKVAGIILIIWAGISLFLIHIEIKLKKIEAKLKDQQIP